MSIDVDLHRVDFNKYYKSLNKKFPQINDEVLLRRVMSEFGTFITDNDFIILHNEYYEDGICTWNMDKTIAKAFNLKDNAEPESWGAEFDVQDSFFEAREMLISYKEFYEACENLGLDYTEDEEED